MTELVNGIELFCEKTGTGRPLILLHGNGEDHTIFQESVEVLKDHFTCYCPDSRGHGRSTYVSGLHYSDMAEDMVLLMDQLDLKDVVFYGFSDGGIAGLLAAAKSRRVTELIVSGANLTPKGVKWPLRCMMRVSYLFHRDPKLMLMLTEPCISDDTLKTISARTTVLAGSRDVIREKETRHIARMVPGAQLRILEGEGHGTYVVHQRKLAGLILECTGQTEQ